MANTPLPTEQTSSSPDGVVNNTTSFLDSIIASSKEEKNDENQNQQTPSSPSGGNGEVPPSSSNEQPPQKKREPVSPGTILKFIGAILLVGIIFFGSFLAYIVFNPDQAYFFVTVFGVNPNDIATVLKKLINGSFGIVILVLSIVWMISLFRAIWTPKEFKRKRLLGWMTATLVGIILFSILTFWAYLFRVIKTLDFPNLSGNVLIYDNDLLNNAATKAIAKLENTSNLIGPITLKFDISQNAKQVQNKNSFQINNYSIDFDGASCNDGSSLVNGSDPLGEKSIVCIFDTVKNYNINGTYQGVDRLGNPVNIDITIPPIEIRGVLNIREQKNKDGKTIKTLDATKLKTLGTPRWKYYNSSEILTQDTFTEELSTKPIIVEFSLFGGDSSDRTFVLESVEKKTIGGDLTAVQETINPLGFHFQIDNLTVNQNLIVSIEWTLDDGSIICRDSNSEMCDHVFSSYGKRTVQATITLASGEKYTVEKMIAVDEPILLTRHAIVTNEAGQMLNTPDTYDTKLKSYLIENVVPPEVLTFDARDIVAENLGYRLSSVLWEISDGKNTEQKRGEKVSFPIETSVRYTVNATYTFMKNGSTGTGDTKVSRDSITIDIERKELTPRLSVISSSDYVPTTVTVDGSQSRSEHGEIIKFSFDFGEGKPAAEGDAIQTYEYTSPGNKEIVLTITDSNGNTAAIKKVMVLKETPRSVDFSTSLSPGTINTPVDFTASNSIGMIEDYIWSFGDNTPTVRGYEVSHTFSQPGTYNVSLTLVYSDGTRKSTSKPFVVVSSID